MGTKRSPEFDDDDHGQTPTHRNSREASSKMLPWRFKPYSSTNRSSLPSRRRSVSPCLLASSLTLSPSHTNNPPHNQHLAGNPDSRPSSSTSCDGIPSAHSLAAILFPYPHHQRRHLPQASCAHQRVTTAFARPQLRPDLVGDGVLDCGEDLG
jgi:hypothetical protein